MYLLRFTRVILYVCTKLILTANNRVCLTKVVVSIETLRKCRENTKLQNSEESTLIRSFVSSSSLFPYCSLPSLLLPSFPVPPAILHRNRRQMLVRSMHLPEAWRTFPGRHIENHNGVILAAVCSCLSFSSLVFPHSIPLDL